MQPVELIVLQYLYVTSFVGILLFYITVLFNIEEGGIGDQCVFISSIFIALEKALIML